MEKEYKKDYRGFIIWLIAFIGAIFIVPIIPTENVNFITLVIMNIMSISMAILTGIIYLYEKIYWYTGITYEDAVKVSSERRKEYAMKQFKRFAIFAVVFFFYSVIAFCADLSIVWSIQVSLFGIVGVAISTITIKLK